MRAFVILFCFCLSLVGSKALALSPLSATERAQYRVDAAGYEIDLFVLHPADCTKPDILFVMHGIKRKAASIRDKAEQLARRHCLVVFAPKFDAKRFPGWRYQRGGLLRDGKLLDQKFHSSAILSDLVLFARRYVALCCRAGSGPAGDVRALLFGHSAGGQFVSRIAAYAQLDFARIIVANPSTHVAADDDEQLPYGFGGFPGNTGQRLLANYLAAPVAIVLGEEDTGSKYLNKGRAAMRQGANRLLRGRNIFAQASQQAASLGLPFNWQLIEVKGVGHSSRGILQSPELARLVADTLAAD